MPGLPPENKKNQVALMPEDDDARPTAQQPRQPANLQGLLRFAMEAQNQNQGGPSREQGGAEGQPIDAERREFLEEALKSMSVDVIALMKKQIEILQDMANVTENELDEKLAAFDKILEFADNIDLANDFHKINGFSIFDPCLQCKLPEIRASACDLLAELAQNNPYIQNVICDATNLMATLLKIMETDPENQVVIKALYAVSCITRDSDIGYQNFKLHKGLEVMKKIVIKDNEKIQTKTTFLLSALHRLDMELLNNLMALDFPPLLVRLLIGEWKSSHEHILSLLLLLAEHVEDFRNDLKAGKYDCKNIIQSHLDLIAGNDSNQEEQFYCQQLLAMAS